MSNDSVEPVSNELLFALNPNASPSLQVIGGRIPVLIVDDLFLNPAAIRSHALTLPFRPPDYPYPGRIAVPSAAEASKSLQHFVSSALMLVNSHYLPKIPPIAENGQRITQLSRAETDFAITDVHPDELEETQRKPHTDPVPIFGLIYLNPESRGGTLFFDPPRSDRPKEARLGYCSIGDTEFRFIGKVEGVFNRLAIYPGFVLHTGEISGSWIRSDDRHNSPRLTQRLVFFP